MTESKKMKHLIIAGAPGSGKSEIASLLEKLIPQSGTIKSKYVVRDNTLLLPSLKLTAMGSLADYRTENALAVSRLKNFHESTPMIYKHSLLDSVAYPAVRLYHMANSGSVSEDEMARWYCTLMMHTTILRDTFPTDTPVIFLRGHAEDGDITEEFANDVEIALRDTLNEFNIAYTELTTPEEAATFIAEYLTSEEDDNNNTNEGIAAVTSGKD